MTRRALVVCTANVCRSPTTERLLQRRLDGTTDVDGETWVVRSAGTSPHRVQADPRTHAAAAARGIDLSGHQARFLDGHILHEDGADLVLTMTREQVRHVVSIDPAWWPRTFTLKELVRRASRTSPAIGGEGFAGWLGRVAADRTTAELMGSDPIDDVGDPYGAPRRRHDEMVAEIERLIDALVRLGPWSVVSHRPR